MSVFKTAWLLGMALSIFAVRHLQAEVVFLDTNSYTPVTAAFGATPTVTQNGQAWSGGVNFVSLTTPILASPLGNQYSLSGSISTTAGDATNFVTISLSADNVIDGSFTIDGRGILIANSAFFGAQPLQGTFTTVLNLNNLQSNGTWLHSSVIQQNGTDIVQSYLETSSTIALTNLVVSVTQGSGFTSSFGNLQLTEITAVPEPGSATLLASLGVCIGFLRRRYRLQLNKSKLTNKEMHGSCGSRVF